MVRIITLKDGLEVEVAIDDQQAREISTYGNLKVDTTIDQMQSMLKKVIKPISNTYKELSKEMQIDSAKVTIGVNIGIEGNFILAKSNAGANIQVEIVMRTTNG